MRLEPVSRSGARGFAHRLGGTFGAFERAAGGAENISRRIEDRMYRIDLAVIRARPVRTFATPMPGIVVEWLAETHKRLPIPWLYRPGRVEANSWDESLRNRCRHLDFALAAP